MRLCKLAGFRDYENMKNKDKECPITKLTDRWPRGWVLTRALQERG
jgi:hypothetical protein